MWEPYLLMNSRTCSCTWSSCVMTAQIVCDCWTAFHTDVADCPESVFNPVQFIIQFFFVCSLLFECFVILFTVYLPTIAPSYFTGEYTNCVLCTCKVLLDWLTVCSVPNFSVRYWLHWAESFRSFLLLGYSVNYQHAIETEGSLAYSEEPGTGPSHVTDDSGLCPCVILA
jgi:hypothetical protein